MSDTQAGTDSPMARRREAAWALVDQGRTLEAERAFEDILRESPADVDALNYLAICSHGRGGIAEALQMLERARAAWPLDATTLTNLGVLHREQGRIGEAHEALAAALAANPDSYVARLRLAEVLQALGRHAEALPAYFGAIMAAQGRGLWMDAGTTPPALQPLVLHAMSVVGRGRPALFAALLDPLRERHGGAALLRVEKALAVYLMDLPATYPEPLQRPRFFYFPDLPTPRFFDRELFPWYAELEAHAPAIRAEMVEVLAEDSAFEPFLGHVDDRETLHKHLRGDGAEPAWNAFFFYRHGERHVANAQRCPRTSSALEAAPLCRVRQHAPEACYSVLTPGSHILPHHGVTNTRVVTHLPLVVPSDCALVVGGEARSWEEGTCFSFDDTFEHEAWNRSADTRVVLLLDAWNPYLTEVEKTAVAELIGGIGDFNRAAAVA